MHVRHDNTGDGPHRSAHSKTLRLFQICAPLLALWLSTVPADSDWPLNWDFGGRSDTPVAAQRTSEGDLLVLVESYRQGFSAPSAVILRIDPLGQIVWARADHELSRPAALALGNDGRALILGRAGSEFRITSLAPDGTIEWSRNRGGISQDFPEYGPAAQPIWDADASAWRIPAGIDGDMVVLSWTGDGSPLADLWWSPPSGEAIATAVVPRPSGGLLITGRGETTIPGWWTVALDAAGDEIWSHFEDGETDAGIFSGAFPVVADSERITVWADDETICGLFSLRLWSLDAATGAPLWDTTWPPPGDCTFLIPDVVHLSMDRILASGATTHFGSISRPETAAIAFDADTGATVWERGHSAETLVIRTDLSTSAGSSLVASTLFPPVNPGPTPLLISAWNRDGDACTQPFEILPARVAASIAGPDGTWYVIGSAWSNGTAENLIVQAVADPCRNLFVDGFESGNLGAWSQSTLQ